MSVQGGSSAMRRKSPDTFRSNSINENETSHERSRETHDESVNKNMKWMIGKPGYLTQTNSPAVKTNQRFRP
jgi:hypothetical protein